MLVSPVPGHHSLPAKWCGYDYVTKWRVYDDAVYTSLGGHDAGDYSITNTATTTESLGFTVNFTATDSSGNVSPAQSFTVNPVDLYINPSAAITINEAATQTLTGSIFASVTENAASITPASISNVTVSGTGASLSQGANGIDTITSKMVCLL